MIRILSSLISRSLPILSLSLLISCSGGKNDSEAKIAEPETFSITPSANFEFVEKFNVFRDKWVESETIIIGGISRSTEISVSGGEYRINNDDFTTYPDLIQLRDTLTVRVKSSPSYGTTEEVSVTIGDTTRTFKVTTLDQGSSLAPFTFPEKRNAEAGQWAESDAFKLYEITGSQDTFNLNIEAGEFAVNGVDFSSQPRDVNANDDITLRIKASEVEKGKITATLASNDLIAEFSVVTDGRQLGLNFNEQVNEINPDSGPRLSLDKLKSEWVRGFINYFEIFDKPNPDNFINNYKRINNMIDLHNSGYKVTFSIKFDFSEKGGSETRDFPEIDSAEIQTYKDNLRKVYDKIWAYTDVIVVGNEPFIETRAAAGNHPRLANFYKEMTNFTILYQQETGSETSEEKSIYVGAFNRINQENWQNDASLELLDYAKTTPEVAGVDLHIHHNEYSTITESLDFIENQIRDDQKIIATEFSAVHFWKSQLNNPLSDAFVSLYNEHTQTVDGTQQPLKVFEYLDKILKIEVSDEVRTVHAVTRKEWLDFVSLHDWYNDQQNYLSRAYDLLTASPAFKMGFYAFRQSYSFTAPFTEKTDPWVLNGIYANRTVQLLPEGEYQLNFNFHNDFDRLR